MKNIAVILSGAGYLDGSEIHESVLTLLEIEKNNATWSAFSVDKKQADVLDHNAESAVSESRNVLIESARITRGNVENICNADPKDFDAVIIPGGFGAAKNLCDFATKGDGMSVDNDLKNFLVSFKQTGRPIAAICIAPVLLAKVFGELTPEITIGDNEDVENTLVSWGANPKKCRVHDIVIDTKNNFFTTPAYMLGTSVSEVSPGIEKLVKAVLN